MQLVEYFTPICCISLSQKNLKDSTSKDIVLYYILYYNMLHCFASHIIFIVIHINQIKVFMQKNDYQTLAIGRCEKEIIFCNSCLTKTTTITLLTNF